jgi:hypothetical protein
MFEETPKIHVSMSRKFSDGNYGHGEVSMSVSHIPFDATSEEVDQYIEKAAFVVDRMKKALREKVAVIRQEETKFGPAPAAIENSQFVARK